MSINDVSVTKQSRNYAQVMGFKLLSFVTQISLVSGVVLATVSPALALEFVTNLNESDDVGQGIDPMNWAGSSFTTGNDSYTLDQVTLNMAQPALGDLFVALYTDSSGIPGSLYANLLVPFVGSIGNYNFTPSSTVALSPNTTYHVVAGYSMSGSALWRQTGSFNQTSVAGWTIQDGYSFSNNQGASWTTLPSTVQRFSVSATVATPIPFSPSGKVGYSVLGLGLLYLGWRNFYKKKVVVKFNKLEQE